MLIKLDAIDSTNSYLRRLYKKEAIEDYTVVMTKYQTKGRGQMGATWNSEKSKNLMCSVFKQHVDIKVKEHFYLNIITSLALIRTLESYEIAKLKVKWPNDILADKKKICGILVENVIRNKNIDTSIIGIGLNVNQKDFNNLPNATSMKNLSDIDFSLEDLVANILINLRYYFKQLYQKNFDILKNEYEFYLFKRKKISQFKLKNGTLMTGSIQSVNKKGNLIVRLNDKTEEAFDLKEIQLLY